MQHLDPRSKRLLRDMKKAGYARKVAICGEIFELQTVRDDNGKVYLYLSMIDAITDVKMKELLDELVELQTDEVDKDLSLDDLVPGCVRIIDEP